jgi:hypothetical protein
MGPYFSANACLSEIVFFLMKARSEDNLIDEHEKITI